MATTNNAAQGKSNGFLWIGGGIVALFAAILLIVWMSGGEDDSSPSTTAGGGGGTIHQRATTQDAVPCNNTDYSVELNSSVAKRINPPNDVCNMSFSLATGQCVQAHKHGRPVPGAKFCGGQGGGRVIPDIEGFTLVNGSHIINVRRWPK